MKWWKPVQWKPSSKNMRHVSVATLPYWWHVVVVRTINALIMQTHRHNVWSVICKPLHSNTTVTWKQQADKIKHPLAGTACSRWELVLGKYGHVLVCCWSHSWALKTEPIKMLFGMLTRAGPKNHCIRPEGHGHHLENTTEWSMLGSEAGCY